MFHTEKVRFRLLQWRTWDLRLFETHPREDLERTELRRASLTPTGRTLFGCVVVISLLCVWARAYTHTPVENAFRASVPVADSDVAAHPSVPALLALLAANPHICGLTAAALQRYERVVVVRSTSSGAMLPLVNPRFEAFERTRWEEVEETSWLCNPPVTNVRSRAQSGRVTYRVPGAYEAVKLSGADAHCVQHLIAELNGEWWCPPAHTIWPQLPFPPTPGTRSS